MEIKQKQLYCFRLPLGARICPSRRLFFLSQDRTPRDGVRRQRGPKLAPPPSHPYSLRNIPITNILFICFFFYVNLEERNSRFRLLPKQPIGFEETRNFYTISRSEGISDFFHHSLIQTNLRAKNNYSNSVHLIF